MYDILRRIDTKVHLLILTCTIWCEARGASQPPRGRSSPGYATKLIGVGQKSSAGFPFSQCMDVPMKLDSIHYTTNEFLSAAEARPRGTHLPEWDSSIPMRPLFPNLRMSFEIHRIFMHIIVLWPSLYMNIFDIHQYILRRPSRFKVWSQSGKRSPRGRSVLPRPFWAARKVYAKSVRNVGGLPKGLYGRLLVLSDVQILKHKNNNDSQTYSSGIERIGPRQKSEPQ